MLLDHGISREDLNDFFSFRSGDVLNRRESYKIEFKEIFDWWNKKSKSKYLKVISSFANNSGGLMIFGVSDSPRKIVGIDNFEKVDDADITNDINANFNQQISFVRDTYELNGVTLGIVKVFESRNKPVVCIQDSKSMKENGIYYRYNSKSSEINSGELRYIIEERVENERNKWLNLLENIAQVGINKVGLMNLDEGEITFAGNKVLVDERLLSELKIIDEYSLERDGAPALKLKGEIDSSAQIIRQPYIIQTEDIYKAFLGISDVVAPGQYLKAIFHEQSNSFPIWFLLKQLANSREDAKNQITKYRSQTVRYKEILKRVDEDKIALKFKNHYNLKTGPRSPLRLDVFTRFLEEQQIIYNDQEEARTLLEALSNINSSDVEFSQVQKSLINIFNDSFPFENQQHNYLFRNTLTLVDYLYFSFE